MCFFKVYDFEYYYFSNQIDTEKESKIIRELDEFWQTVRDNPSDFIGWTCLLKYVDGIVNL